MIVTKKVTLITGVAGTTGSEILDLLAKDPEVMNGEREVVGIDNFFRGSRDNIKIHLAQDYFRFFNMKWQYFIEIEKFVSKTKTSFTLSPLERRVAELFDSSKYCIDEIYHMAAVVPTKYFYESPDLTYEENCKGTIDLFNWARSCGVKRFITGSSSEIYGHIREEDLPAKETTMSHFDSEETSTRWSYAEGKILTEHYLNHFKDSMERVCHLRFANTYGVRDMDDNHVLPYLVNHIVNNEEVHINKDAGLYCRTFLNNKDSSRACVELMKKGRNGVAYNVGSEEEVTIERLLYTVRKLAIDLGVIEDYDLDKKVYRDVSRPGDPMRRVLCTDRLYKDTGFRPQVFLEEGITEMILKAKEIRDSGKNS